MQATGRIEGEVNILVEGGYLENVKAVTRSNSVGCIYIIGDDKTDGSIRLKFTSGETFAHIEKLTIGQNVKKV